ncbi:pyridoxamine 5'-phosphate oxidase family protein [Caldimonas thermodepolymerans]|jgi:Predicted flavin-nucleotide-binding protein structurally related to pyridoxine 5''-phosphate oxidase|uniref:pyridoxamine 5'-phosphate oxidase family protein n=1 Tax=Caldimonas thermodepolymerans TaxID=215580 RepID=UPI002491F5A1|nr:pyridoxamine 5'-phosphate oxidase family protein [Caldimonas thermodepolymerans]
MNPSALPGQPHAEDPFHAGERELQARAGVRERLAEIGRRVIRDHMPDQHRELFGKLPFLVAGSLDEAGRPWASLLAGTPGFVTTPDARTLHVGALPQPDDPLARQLAVGQPLGLLGIELPTRRRNRVNGRVRALDAGGITVAVEQSFGNCAQYIQARSPLPRAAPPREAPARVEREGARLGERARALVAGADTLFIATAAAGGADVSHRGGRPGFVRVDERGGRTVLTLPDFRGNHFFNTLGNIALHPRAGLSFVDFERGDLLLLTGRAQIVWDGPEVQACAGALRLLRVEVEQGLWLASALPWAWSAPEPAPQLQATGTWEAPHRS